MACTSCDSVSFRTNFGASVNYPTGFLKPGEYYNITVTVDAGLLITGGTFQVCLYKNGQAIQSKTLNFGMQVSGSQTATFNMVMDSTDSNFIVNVFEVGFLGTDCIYSQGFIVYVTKIITPPPITNGGTTPTACDPSKSIDFSKYGLSFLGCVPTSQVIIVGAGFILLASVLKK